MEHLHHFSVNHGTIFGPFSSIDPIAAMGPMFTGGIWTRFHGQNHHRFDPLVEPHIANWIFLTIFEKVSNINQHKSPVNEPFSIAMLKNVKSPKGIYIGMVIFENG